jgi:hypothetical protein
VKDDYWESVLDTEEPGWRQRAENAKKLKALIAEGKKMAQQRKAQKKAKKEARHG